jgi:hypothetical protein
MKLDKSGEMLKILHMKDFEKIRKICEENSKMSEKLIDGFLLYYAAGRNNLEHEMNQKFALYKHLNRVLKAEWINRLKSQYIIHKVFRSEGLIKHFLNHPALKALDVKERNYLEFQAEHPWRFCFSIIIDNPADSFFVMEDVFSEQEFLLYSPGVKQTLEEKSVILWFNLISYNDTCWQSFGPIGAYNSFEPDDIFFFATEINHDIADENQIMANIESNPLPYMMLLSGGNTPLIFNKKDQIVHVLAEYELSSLNTKALTKSFISEYNKGVYRLSLEKWCEPPHFSQAYYDENKKILVLTASTDRGFTALAKGLNEYGYNFSADPFMRVNPSMIITASDILKRKIRLTKYDDLFSKETSTDSRKGLDRLNAFIKLVLPDLNAGRKPDIESLAAKAGVDIPTATVLLKHVLDKIKKMNTDADNR